MKEGGGGKVQTISNTTNSLYNLIGSIKSRRKLEIFALHNRMLFIWLETKVDPVSYSKYRSIRFKYANASSSLGLPVGSHVIGTRSDPGSSGYLSQIELQLSMANEPTKVGVGIRKLPQMVKV
jgi:hypothetical protein